MRFVKYILILLIVISFGSNLLAAPDYQAQITTNGPFHTFFKGAVNRTYRIPVLKLRGTYYEMGLEYGVLHSTMVWAPIKKTGKGFRWV